MKPILFVSLIVLACARLSAEDFTTIEGKKYEGVTVSRVEPDGLMVVTDSGIAKIPFARLPEDVQKKYGYDPKTAAAFSAGVAKSQRDNFARWQALQDEHRKKTAEVYAQDVERQNAQRVALDGQAQDVAIQAAQHRLLPPLEGGVVLSNGKNAVEARDLVQGMTKNALAFEQVIGQRITVYGRIEKLDRDPDGNPRLYLEARNVIGAVKCVFTPADTERLQGRLGNNAIVEGKLEGVTFGIVKMSACRFTQ